MRTWAAFFLLLSALPCAAQRDFLRADEIDMLREAQDPNERLPLYVKFAQERVSLIQQLTAREKPGRTSMIKDALGEYSKIIDAIDAVSDDALQHRRPADIGIAAVVAGEKGMLAALQKVAQSAPSDLTLYRFVLEQAIEATQDSLDLALEDMGTREAAVESKEQKERQERESMMRPEEVEAKQAEQKKEAEQKRKVPTLRRPGETAPPSR